MNDEGLSLETSAIIYTFDSLPPFRFWLVIYQEPRSIIFYTGGGYWLPKATARRERHSPCEILKSKPSESQLVLMRQNLPNEAKNEHFQFQGFFALTKLPSL